MFDFCVTKYWLNLWVYLCNSRPIINRNWSLASLRHCVTEYIFLPQHCTCAEMETRGQITALFSSTFTSLLFTFLLRLHSGLAKVRVCPESLPTVGRFYDLVSRAASSSKYFIHKPCSGFLTGKWRRYLNHKRRCHRGGCINIVLNIDLNDIIEIFCPLFFLG